MVHRSPQQGSAGESIADKSEDLSLIPRNHVLEGNNQLPLSYNLTSACAHE